MPTLSAIRMSPTGKSVARSHENAVTKLVPVGTIIIFLFVG